MEGNVEGKEFVGCIQLRGMKDIIKHLSFFFVLYRENEFRRAAIQLLPHSSDHSALSKSSKA